MWLYTLHACDLKEQNKNPIFSLLRNLQNINLPSSKSCIICLNRKINIKHYFPFILPIIKNYWSKNKTKLKKYFHWKPLEKEGKKSGEKTSLQIKNYFLKWTIYYKLHCWVYLSLRIVVRKFRLAKLIGGNLMILFLKKKSEDLPESRRTVVAACPGWELPDIRRTAPASRQRV